MKLILTTHNLTLTQAIENHILSRIDKLEHFDRFAINARVTLDHDSTKAVNRQFKCSMRLAVPGPDLFAEDSEGDMYAAIDLVTKKLNSKFVSVKANIKRASIRSPHAPNAVARKQKFKLQSIIHLGKGEVGCLTRITSLALDNLTFSLSVIS